MNAGDNTLTGWWPPPAGMAVTATAETLCSQPAGNTVLLIRLRKTSCRPKPLANLAPKLQTCSLNYTDTRDTVTHAKLYGQPVKRPLRLGESRWARGLGGRQAGWRHRSGDLQSRAGQNAGLHIGLSDHLYFMQTTTSIRWCRRPGVRGGSGRRCAGVTAGYMDTAQQIWNWWVRK